MAANVVSIGMSGKSVSEHVLDVITGADCNFFQAATHAGRNICEPRETAATTPDVQALSDPGTAPEGPSAVPIGAVGPSGPFNPGPAGDPGGPSLDGLY
ncbi:hypothetical protein [Azospirillum sp. sgz301742]